MDDQVLIHGDYWKVTDVKSEVEWCRSEKWSRHEFVPRGAIKSHHQNAESNEVVQEIIPGGWDHEHCQICFWKIRQAKDPAIGIGFTNGTVWVCSECYALGLSC